jgi:hypothetical protein
METVLGEGKIIMKCKFYSPGPPHPKLGLDIDLSLVYLYS